MRLLLLQVHITPDRAPQIPHRDEQRHPNRPLPRRREIVADPREHADERRINARRDAEEEGVGQAGEAGVRDAEEGEEGGGGEAEGSDDEGPARAVAVGEDGDGDGGDDAEGVDGDREELGGGG